MGGRGGSGGGISENLKRDMRKYFGGMGEKTKFLNEVPEGWKVETIGLGVMYVNNGKSIARGERERGVIVQDVKTVREKISANKEYEKALNQYKKMSDAEFRKAERNFYEESKKLKKGSKEAKKLSAAQRAYNFERQLRESAMIERMEKERNRRYS